MAHNERKRPPEITDANIRVLMQVEEHLKAEIKAISDTFSEPRDPVLAGRLRDLDNLFNRVSRLRAKLTEMQFLARIAGNDTPLDLAEASPEEIERRMANLGRAVDAARNFLEER